jgi:RND family efflux transporter MFP subunit
MQKRTLGVMSALVVAAIPLSFLSGACRRGNGSGTSPAEKPPVAVETAKALAGTLMEGIDVVGTLEPKNATEVKSEYPGTVTEVLVTEWVPVKRGQLLARLDARESEAAFLLARAQLENAEREYERAIGLEKAGLLTAQGLEAARTARDAAHAQQLAAEARRDKGTIRAPMDGMIASRSVNVGDHAGDLPLFRIVDNRRFDLTVAVPASRLSFVKVGQELAFTSESVPGETFSGRVAFINPAADSASRTFRVIAEVANAGGKLRSDIFVRGRIVTGKREGVIQVPREALLAWDVEAKRAELYSIAGGKASRREVTTGTATGDQVEIVSGLSAGEEVATRGAFNLRDGDRVLVSTPPASAAPKGH